ncbi:MAG: hypothetical protein KatS3mg094_055 [Candidatus Parcubacteria bacterium]|nr:MAG: hypothetical protein KatS3mg094_055 [Candidatus Parcubacteria bacterium]
MTEKTIYLSPSKLNLFLNCPLCFWLSEVEKVHRPEGISSTLPRGMDLLIKKYFDKYRALGKLPPEIEGKVRGKLINESILKKWRTTHKYSEPFYYNERLDAVLFGGLDECLVDDEYYIPTDYKTYGFELKENSHSFHQLQLDAYTLMLQANGYKHLNLAYLIYYIPQEIKENGVIKFKVEVVEVKTNPENAKMIFESAINLLRGPKPKSHSECEYCSWTNEFFKH